MGTRLSGSTGTGENRTNRPHFFPSTGKNRSFSREPGAHPCLLYDLVIFIYSAYHQIVTH